jgi:uncharacterized protein (TIGR00730 family)
VTVEPMICVFAGSSPGRGPEYVAAAERLGEALVTRGYGLVYGGARVGLMGTVADTVLRLGGSVIGVIPESLVKKEVAHRELTELRVVTSMHERKAVMSDLASSFIALPGGLGTLEEMFEVFTWAQLGMHRKGCGLLNVAGYYDQLLSFLHHAVEERFLRDAHRDMLIIESDPGLLIDALSQYEAPVVEKWIDREGR